MKVSVTPFVGVWIETSSPGCWCDGGEVTPFVGVWIETLCCWCDVVKVRSHPSWVCGLKLEESERTPDEEESHPSWVCGLKHKDIVVQEDETCHTLRGCVD